MVLVVEILTNDAHLIRQILQAQGKYQDRPPLPFILGAEFAGRISLDSPIPDGCKLQRGQRVFGSRQGSFADKVAVNYNHILPLPDNISFDQGAGNVTHVSIHSLTSV